MTAVAAQQSSRPEQVVNPKTALLDRLGQLKRSPIDYRGDRDGQQRIRYEWCTTVVDDFLFVKEQLLAEASMGREHSVREQWFFRDVTLTYQELFPVPPGDDDKLFPIFAHRAIGRAAPAATWEGLVLRGKDGELKGTALRPYVTRASRGAHYLDLTGGGYRFNFVLEYRDEKGDRKTAGGYSLDAFNVLWSDIKDRVAIDLTDAKSAENWNMMSAAL